MIVLNLTQHRATPEQVLAGVVDLYDQNKVSKLLTFSDVPDRSTLEMRANAIADLAVKRGVRFAMIGGAPYLMPCLERALIDRDVVPLYAFSKRECHERRNPDGSVSKTMVFRHEGFVSPASCSVELK